MAKKSRSVTAKAAPTFAGIQHGTVNTEFNPDYSTIKTELKQIGTLAAGFFVFLIVLSIVLPLIIK
jgi:hypothetical protein